MLAAGVASRARTGRLIDRFRDRVMLPITRDGDVLGFVGRRHPALTDDAGRGPGVPKYLNTADTPLFHKGAQLYGIPPWPLPDDAALVLVEGPMDAIAVTLAGGGAFVGVATLGTSLTHQQAAQLAAMGRPLVVATDGDLPGRVAAERDFWMLAPHGLAPAVALFPDGSDPADVLTRRGPQALLDTLHRARPLSSLLVEERLANLTGETALQQASQILAAQPSTTWDAGSRHVAQRLGVPLQTARACLAGHAEDWNRDPRTAAQQQLTAIREVRARLEDVRGTRAGRPVARTGPGTRPPTPRPERLARPGRHARPRASGWTRRRRALPRAHRRGAAAGPAGARAPPPPRGPAPRRRPCVRRGAVQRARDCEPPPDRRGHAAARRRRQTGARTRLHPALRSQPGHQPGPSDGHCLWLKRRTDVP